MKEAEFAQRVEETCNYLQLRWHHETDSRRSKAGFPDYCIVGPFGVLFLELKADKGRVSPQQQAWIDDLNEPASLTQGPSATNALMAYVAYPRDWNRVLSDLKRIAGR